MGFAELLVGDGKGSFEGRPGFGGGGLAFPEFALVVEHAGFENQLVGDGGDLDRGIRCVTGGGKIDGVFDLVEEYFDGLVRVVVGLHLGVVGEEIRGADVGVCGVEVVQNVACAAILVADVFGV